MAVTNDDTTGLKALMATLLKMSQDQNPAPTPTPTPSPTPDTFTRLQALLGPPSGGTDLVGAINAMRNTPVADYTARQEVAARQGAATGLAATSAEDIAANRAAAQGVVNSAFGGPPSVGSLFTKMLPDNQGTLTAFPSGGYAVSRTPEEQAAIVAERKRRFAAANPNYKPPTGPKLRYGSSGGITDLY